MRLSGERVTTPAGGFNPTWQRHVAAYRLVAPYATGALVLDLGCGVGHSYELLAATRTVGLDLDLDALVGQDRSVVRADMRRVPLQSESVDAVVSVQSLEHVPDPEHVTAEVARVLVPGGTAVFVTPNRLTFGRPDEIIDPWHFVEYDAADLAQLCRSQFAEVEILGLHGSAAYLEFQESELDKLDRLLRLDPLRLRRFVPRTGRQWAYSTMLERSRRAGRPLHPLAAQITPEDFRLIADDLAGCLDLVAVCREPRPATA